MSAVREGIWGILLSNYEAFIGILTRVVTRLVGDQKMANFFAI